MNKKNTVTRNLNDIVKITLNKSGTKNILTANRILEISIDTSNSYYIKKEIFLSFFNCSYYEWENFGISSLFNIDSDGDISLRGYNVSTNGNSLFFTQCIKMNEMLKLTRIDFLSPESIQETFNKKKGLEIEVQF